jgi:hypothetical protein
VLAKDPDPLQALREEIEERKGSSWRTNRVALLPNGYKQEVLFDICLACARLWNELNYEKRRAFFNGELSPGKRDEINKKYYHKYKGYCMSMHRQLLPRMTRHGAHSSSSWI